MRKKKIAYNSFLRKKKKSLRVVQHHVDLDIRFLIADERNEQTYF